MIHVSPAHLIGALFAFGCIAWLLHYALGLEVRA